ncbi:EAL domain-containing protein [Luteimonas composti]|uniref:EAL domain-containing protein n=1 Tax=Luteimonas composti TaxID=398257 RepID=A0ABT6MT72_9GAMM|nr:EAL domain-containing response regulator [Luteimonas composti]MDH7453832.1 EAL domain-containing protein [Luteimonas composti]
MSDADNRQRAEFPPTGFWRRWCADAAPAELPRVDAPATAVELTPAPAQAPAVSGRDVAPAYRVLVVEDDPSQALFAESVLNGAGMEARVVAVTSEVMDAMQSLRPDLVLMDLHMPGLDGVELTTLIRRHPDFAMTPVVFLTGDEDPERRFEVLDVGADDFLRKPVRPRHLVSAVQSRILRARMLQAAGSGARHPATGLHTRPQMLQLLTTSVPGATSGAALFVEIAGTAALRDRFGYAALEELLTEAGRRLAAICDGHAASRLNDNTFLVFATGVSGAALPPLARQLRDGFGEHPFQVGGERLRLRAVVGYADLSQGFEDAGAALSAAEEALRAARAHPHGVAAWTRPVSAQDRELAAVEQALRDALASGSLLAAFQPIVAVAGGDEAQYQVLLRLRGGGGELHPAGRVLQAASRIGATLQVDRRMAEIAIGALRRQREEQRALRLFVTQSPSTLAHDGHAQWLLQTLADAGVDGASLVIDVRQEDALVHALSLQEFCSAMVSAGVQLCLSQYCHGPEANALLGQLPLGYVRLDSRYSRNLDDTAVRDEMRAAIDYAHRMGLQVIGQQVEDAQSAATLWMTGVDFIQGNLVQRPAGDLQFDFHTSVL